VANVHSLLGRRYQEIGRFDDALKQFESAIALSANLYGEDAEQTLMAMDRLVWVYLEVGRHQEASRLSGRLRELWESRLQGSDLSLLIVRTRIARTALSTGAYGVAEEELRGVLREVATSDRATPLSMRLLKAWLGVAPAEEAAPRVLEAYAKLLLAGNVLEEFGDGHDEAAAILEDSLATFSAVLGDEAELTALARFTMAVVLANVGQYERAEGLALQMRDSFDRVLPEGHYARSLSRLALGRLRAEQRRYQDAAALLKEAVDLCKDENGCPPRLRFEFLWNLGRTHVEAGHGDTAAEILRSTLEVAHQIWGENHQFSLLVRTSLADALRQTGAIKEAAAALSAIDPSTIAGLRPYQQAKGDLHRVQGLIQFEQGEHAAAVASLERSLGILERRLGATHWRSSRTRSELQAARAALKPP
jgi:tetratricopeptide (TPR) repeat protein